MLLATDERRVIAAMVKSIDVRVTFPMFRNYDIRIAAIVNMSCL